MMCAVDKLFTVDNFFDLEAIIPIGPAKSPKMEPNVPDMK